MTDAGEQQTTPTWVVAGIGIVLLFVAVVFPPLGLVTGAIAVWYSRHRMRDGVATAGAAVITAIAILGCTWIVVGLLGDPGSALGLYALTLLSAVGVLVLALVIFVTRNGVRLLRRRSS